MDNVQAAMAAGSSYFDIEQRLLRKGGADDAEKLAHLMHLNNNTFMHNHNNNNNNNNNNNTMSPVGGPAVKRTMDDVLKKLSSKKHIRDEHGVPVSGRAESPSPKTRSVRTFL